MKQAEQYKEYPITVTAGVSMEESTEIRDYCAQFDTRMRDVLRELILWAMKNAPIKEVTTVRRTLLLDDKALECSENGRILRGIQPGQENPSYSKRKK